MFFVCFLEKKNRLGLECFADVLESTLVAKVQTETETKLKDLLKAQVTLTSIDQWVESTVVHIGQLPNMDCLPTSFLGKCLLHGVEFTMPCGAVLEYVQSYVWAYLQGLGIYKGQCKALWMENDMIKKTFNDDKTDVAPEVFLCTAKARERAISLLPGKPTELEIKVTAKNISQDYIYTYIKMYI